MILQTYFPPIVSVEPAGLQDGELRLDCYLYLREHGSVRIANQTLSRLREIRDSLTREIDSYDHTPAVAASAGRSL